MMQKPEQIFIRYFQIGNRLSVINYSHSIPIDIKNSSLFIEVDHSGWLQLFQMNGFHIIKKIKSMYPELDINSLKYKIKAKI